MENEVDIITLCNKLTEMTSQERCSWKQTSEKNRFRLGLNNGTIEISKNVANPFDLYHFSTGGYSVSILDKMQNRFASYESNTPRENLYGCLEKLYSTIVDVFEKSRRQKIALLYNELTDTSSNNPLDDKK